MGEVGPGYAGFAIPHSWSPPDNEERPYFLPTALFAFFRCFDYPYFVHKWTGIFKKILRHWQVSHPTPGYAGFAIPLFPVAGDPS
jgi:hypothetical protein